MKQEKKVNVEVSREDLDTAVSMLSVYLGSSDEWTSVVVAAKSVESHSVIVSTEFVAAAKGLMQILGRCANELEAAANTHKDKGEFGMFELRLGKAHEAREAIARAEKAFGGK